MAGTAAVADVVGGCCTGGVGTVTGTADLTRGVAASVDRLAAVGARLPAPSFTLWRGPAERDVAAGDRGVDVAAASAAELPEARAEEAAAVEAVSVTSSAWAVPAPASASPTPRAPAPNHA